MGLRVAFITCYLGPPHPHARTLTGLKPANFIHTLGDAYIYLNHVGRLKILKMLLKVETIDDFKAEGFQIEGYDPHLTIKMEMAA